MSGRIVVRVVSRDQYARVAEAKEQSIPATAHAVTLLLCRAPFRKQIASAMIAGWTITIERIKDRK